jgi:hypothetical protein
MKGNRPLAGPEGDDLTEVSITLSRHRLSAVQATLLHGTLALALVACLGAQTEDRRKAYERLQTEPLDISQVTRTGTAASAGNAAMEMTRDGSMVCFSR